MAPLRLSPDEVKDALPKGSSDLRYLFEKNDVDDELQAMFFHSQINTMAKFSAIASSPDDLRELIKVEFGIDSAAGLQQRLRVTNVLVSYNTALTRVSKQAEVEGELESKHLVKPMAMSEYNSMRTAWEKRYWEIDEELVPARSYLEKKAEELEQGEYRAEPLNVVLTKDQEEPDLMTPVWTSSGQLQMRKGSATIEDPKNPEQLRKRLKVLSLGLMMLSLKHTNRQFLATINPQLFEDFVSYLLSDNCYYLAGRSAEGYNISGPSWQQLLIYEHQVRKKAWATVQNQGTDFSTALRAAWRDPVVKERFLTTPVALAAAGGSKRAYDGDGGGNPRPGKRTQSAGRGKGSYKGKPAAGKGKGKGKGGKTAGERLGCASRTPDGQAICYGYSDFNVRCREKGCRFVHVCGACFGRHPLYACKPGSKAETQGGGVASE